MLPTEAEALRRYLAKAGKLMVLLDPPIGANAAPLPNLEGILKEWGITLGNNVVVDVSGATNDPSIAVAATYPLHPITETFRTLTVYPLARGVDPVEGGTNGRVATTIVETSRGSWAESNLASLTATGRLDGRGEGDKPGPVSLGVGVSAPVQAAPPLPARPAARRRPKPASWSSATLSSPERLRRRAGQPEPVRERHQLARAAGEPHCHPARPRPPIGV